MLYIVATPIGNLSDITLRALDVLKTSDIIFSEDTRVTKKILQRYEISVPVKSLHQHSKDFVYDDVLVYLRSGKKVSYVSDAGTPGVSDPGAKLVSFVRKNIPDMQIIPLPGASAVTTILSVSGIDASQFIFLGYPPHKKGRQTFFRDLSIMTIRPIVFYESPYRIHKAFTSLSDELGEDVCIIVGRELTKIYEDVFFGTIRSAREYFVGVKNKGEFVVVVL